MSFKKYLLTASALALLTGNAFADGGPVPEPAAPPPEPAAPPPEPAPLPEEPAPAPAPYDHWYVAGFGGIVWADDFRKETVNLDVIETDLDPGWGAGGAIGYRWESGYRAELEATYRYNDGEIIFPGQRLNVFDVEIRSLSVMLNVLYDIDLGTFFVPYLGVGLGMTDADMDIGGADQSDGWGFAYQFLGGISIPVPNTSFDLFVDYRYHATTGFGLDPFDDDDEYRTQNVMGGLRFYF